MLDLSLSKHGSGLRSNTDEVRDAISRSLNRSEDNGRIVDPLKKIAKGIQEDADTDRLIAYVDGGIEIVREAMTMLCKCQKNDSNTNAIRTAKGLVERAYTLTVWAALPELHCVEELDYRLDVGTQTEFQIPELELECEASTRSTPNASDCQSSRALRVTNSGRDKRTTKLSPLRRLPSFKNTNFSRVDGSFYFSNAKKKDDSPRTGHFGSPPRNLTLSALSGPTSLLTPRLDSFTKDTGSEQQDDPFAVDLHPFGETLFLDPCRDGLIRCPIDDVHKHIGIFILKATGEVCLWNPKMEELTGIGEAEACGNHVTAFLLSPQEQEEIVKVMDQAVELNETQQLKLSLTCKDGANRCVVSVALVSSVYPRGDYLLAFCHERTPAEARIDTILWTATNIKTLVRKLPPSQDKDAIHAALVRLERVCNRQSAKAWGSVVIADLFGKLRTHYMSEATQFGVELEMERVPKSVPLTIETDTKNLPQILGYLIHNAIRYNRKVDPKVRVSVEILQEEESDLLVFRVSDTGLGIPREIVDTVTTKSTNDECDVDTSQQTGFGLIMAALIVGECGGELLFADHAEEEDSAMRTTVSVVLPLLETAVNSEEMHLSVFKDRNAHNIALKALVVQSNAVARSALCHFLWQRKYAVSIASCADEVSDFNVNILILDIDAVHDEKLFNNLKTVPNLHLILTATDAEARFQGNFGDVQMLTLPLKPGTFNLFLNKIEERIKLELEQNDKIEKVRKAFRTEQDTCPWERKKKLGTGAFGEVYEAVNLLTKGVMAVKIIRLKNTDEAVVQEVVNEVQLMFKLQHPNIIHYFHSQLQDCDGEQQLLIFMEYASGGSLAEKVRNKPVSPDKASSYTTDVLQGLHYLHSHHIIHRDIKTANILITQTARGEVCKVTDFGTAKEMKRESVEGGEEQDELARSLKGTPNFMAPEVMNEEPYNSSADVWSVGCLVLELLTGKLPFAHVSDNPWNVIRYVCSLRPGDKINSSPTPMIGPVQGFLDKTLVVTPADRLSCNALLALPFIAEMNSSVSQRNEIMKIYKKASIAPHRKATKVTFGAKWKDDSSSEGSGEFSGWGSNEGDSPSHSIIAARTRTKTITKQLAFKELADRRRSVTSQLSSNSGWGQ